MEVEMKNINLMKRITVGFLSGVLVLGLVTGEGTFQSTGIAKGEITDEASKNEQPQKEPASGPAVSVPGDTEPKLITSMSLPAKAYVLPKKSITLQVSVLPATATNQKFIWTSSKKKYATVNQEGKVTGKKAGIGKKVKITATATDGPGKSATCTVTVIRKVKKIVISGKSIIKAGSKTKLKAKVSPSNATIKKVKWTSSQKKYATVNSKGVVKTKKSAKRKSVLITAKATDGSKVKKVYYLWIR